MKVRLVPHLHLTHSTTHYVDGMNILYRIPAVHPAVTSSSSEVGTSMEDECLEVSFSMHKYRPRSQTFLAFLFLYLPYLPPSLIL